MTYHFLEHTADAGIEVRAKTLPGLFSEALRGMSDVIAELNRAQGRLERRFELAADAPDLLLLDFLSDALVHFELDQELFVGAELEISEGERGWTLSGVGLGERFDPRRHPPKVMIKAVTYHQLCVERDAEGWRARIIFDI